MPSTNPSVSSLQELVQSIVPESKKNQRLREELISHCQNELSSRTYQNREPDISHLTELVKHHLAQHSQTSTSTLRFTHLLSRLLDQPVLSRPHAAVQFLHTLASSTPATTTDATALPSLGLPRSAKQPSRSTPTPIADPSQQPKKSTGKSKAEILHKYRTKIGRPQLPEEALLRDALYILQGISGKFVRLVESDEQNFESRLIFSDDPQSHISIPNRMLIHRLAELGHLYLRIANFVRQREGRNGVGMIEQSLCHYLEAQLTEYYRIIAVLESQMALLQQHGGEETEAERGAGLTLKRLEVWIDDWRLRLRMMSACVEGCQDVSGGALVNLIHSYTENGDPFVRKVTDELLQEVSKPFFMMLHKWLFSGELYDPFSEFFVRINPELADAQFVQHTTTQQNGILNVDEGFAPENDDIVGDRSGLRLWESKYIFRKEMLPAFVGEDFGRKIFSTGKTLNFIRYSCHDSDWITTREKLGATNDTLQYSDIVGLEHSIDSAYSIVSQRLFDVFFEKFGLMVHLKALKNYIFLAYGDFADALMESLEPHLSRPANTLFRHNLTAKLEEAIRSTNAQNDLPEVHRRLDASMHDYTHGEMGWDVFTLQYKVDAPIDTVLDPDTMDKYLRVFEHLWRLKRAEGALSTGWMKAAGGARTVLRVPNLEGEWHRLRLTIAEMIHFVRQVQAYCHLEVIECQWKKLMEFIHKKEGGLDALISAHRNYVDAVDKKVRLVHPKIGKEENLLRQVRDLCGIMVDFRTAMDDLYDYTLKERDRLEVEWHDAGRGLYVDPRTTKTFAEARKALPEILQRLEAYRTSFSEKVQSLVVSLAAHPDLDCKYLGTRLSFSDFYKIRRDKDGLSKS
ncbi:gamma-tubulin complex, DGRIP91/SPC98 component [Fomitiporia mediterranea MF3/22]|uniref:gamma-tubulin complex, DGRIP91/SPC98 component n=1 Tax=Fomitiporia mediterranea (strain MF3/22) TaxID=694068 RepID=UPI00044075AE|nr:gamma-tubulin complex, DGRIP91/SPC98 component [Fomitiporia mediterranea MF3/22]EJD00999.1 gamma-tubulin complex, DGRIP91/SPC98 component [Fomitiporia mediterranea MF3/22]